MPGEGCAETFPLLQDDAGGITHGALAAELGVVREIYELEVV